RRQLGTGEPPHPGKRAIEHRGRRARDACHGVAPGAAVPLGIACPLVADAQAAEHGLCAVNDEELAMIARQDARKMPRRERVKVAHLYARFAEVAPVRPARSDGAERVVQHAHPDACFRARDERFGKALAGSVGADDVILEVNPALGARDERQHAVERARAVGEMVETVAADAARACGAINGERQLVFPLCPGGHVTVQRCRHHNPSVASTGRSAAMTNAIWSSSGTPSSSAPCFTSSRFTPRAKALSFNFFLTELTSRSAKLREGRTSAHATRNPHSSSTAYNVRAMAVSRGTPV